MLKRMELIAPAHIDNPFTFSFHTPDNMPNPLVRMEKVCAGYGDKVILKSIKLNLVSGARIGLLGRNGASKSILIKLLAGSLQPLSGKIGLAKGIKLGYFAQHQLEYFHADESALQHLSSIAPRLLEQQLRDYLGSFGFQGDKVTETIACFSGGKKARLVLALIVWQRPNLLLNEPTNHLDLDMRQALTEALIDFAGALVVVSHDRHLLRSTTDDLYLVHDGQVEVFAGDLHDYQQWLIDLQRQESQQDAPENESSGNSAQARKNQKRREAEFRTHTQQLRKHITKLEQQMEKHHLMLQQRMIKLLELTIYQRRGQFHVLYQRTNIRLQRGNIFPRGQSALQGTQPQLHSKCNNRNHADAASSTSGSRNSLADCTINPRPRVAAIN